MQENALAHAAVPVGKTLNDEINLLAEKYGVEAVKFAAWGLSKPVLDTAVQSPDSEESLVDRTRRKLREQQERASYVAMIMESAIRLSSVHLTFNDVIATALSFDRSINREEAISVFYDRIDRVVARLDVHSNVTSM